MTHVLLMDQFIRIDTCTWNHDLFGRSNNDLRRRRRGCGIWGFWNVFKIQVLGFLLFELCFSATLATTFDAEDYVSENPNEIDYDDDKNGFFNDIGPPVELMVRKV